jgi:hypothetical protein
VFELPFELFSVKLLVHGGNYPRVNSTNRSAKIIDIPNNEAFVIDSDRFQE